MAMAASLPDFLGLGTQKGGTTTLHRLLDQHPAIHLPACKEVHYFDQHYDKGQSWYSEQFQAAQPGQRCGDITPFYLFHPDVPERIHRLLPHARLIVLLRDPVERAISQLFHARKRGFEPLEPTDAFAAESQRLASGTAYSLQKHSYLSRSRYLEQLDRYEALFPSEQLLILRSEDLFSQPEQVWEQLLNSGVPRWICQDLCPRPMREMGWQPALTQRCGTSCGRRWRTPWPASAVVTASAGPGAEGRLGGGDRGTAVAQQQRNGECGGMADAVLPEAVLTPTVTVIGAHHHRGIVKTRQQRTELRINPFQTQPLTAGTLRCIATITTKGNAGAGAAGPVRTLVPLRHMASPTLRKRKPAGGQPHRSIPPQARQLADKFQVFPAKWLPNDAPNTAPVSVAGLNQSTAPLPMVRYPKRRNPSMMLAPSRQKPSSLPRWPAKAIRNNLLPLDSAVAANSAPPQG